MAIRYEKEPNGEMAIVLSGWQDGIASDPYSGLNYLLGVDLETPGEVAVGYGLTTNATSGGTLNKPLARSTRFFAYTTPGAPLGSAQSYAILDQIGQVYESTSIAGTFTFLSSGNTTISANINMGLAYWMGYLWKFQGTEVYFWNNSVWAKLSDYDSSYVIVSSVPHAAYVAADSKLYFTNNNTVGQISVIPDPTNPVNPYHLFDPSNTATYTFSKAKVGIAPNDQAVSLAEVGGGSSSQSTLLIGGTQNAIYPWDFVSATFSLPIYVADGYIGKMVSVNQNAFIFPGKGAGRGRIYITNGSQADLYFKVPDYIFGEQDPYYEWGDAVFHRNNLLFGFFIDHNSGSGLIQNFNYVWALSLSTHTTASGIAMPEKTFRAISALPTSATFVANATVLIPAVNPNTSGFSYIVGWDNNSTSPGIGYSGTTAGIGSALILSDLIPIGTFLQKKTFTQIEFKLRSPLESGESISISTITDETTNNGSLTFTPSVTTGSISGVSTGVNFTGAQWLKLAISLTGNSATSGCRLYEVRIR